MQAKGILFELFKFFVVDVGLAGHDVDAIIGDSKLFLAVIFDGVVVVEIDHVVIGFV